MKWRFVEEKLGSRAYHAYVKAMERGDSGATLNTEWSWDTVAVLFMKELGIKEGSAAVV